MFLIASALLLASGAGALPDHRNERVKRACRALEENLRDLANDPQGLRAALAKFGDQMVKMDCRVPSGVRVPPSTVKATQAAYDYTVPGQRRTYKAPPPLMASRRRPSPPPPTPVPKAEPPAGEHGGSTMVEDIYITAIVVPDAPSCDGPAAGWISLVDTNDPDPAVRRVQFDSSPPVFSSAPRNTVPKVGDRLEFSSQFPTQIFARSTPCYSDGPCGGKARSGAFTVVGEMSFPAGPRGYLRRQLCVVQTVRRA